MPPCTAFIAWLALVAGDPDLERGLAAMRALDFEVASGHLERAAEKPGHTYEEVVQLLAALGVTRAFLEREVEAREAFRILLSIAPNYALPYTTSPKATFLFESERNALQQTLTTEVLVETDPFTQVGEPVEVILTLSADPAQVIHRVKLLHRLKGSGDYAVREIDAPAVGEQSVLRLPAVTPDAIAIDARGGIVQIAVEGLNERGWEVYRGPSPDHPHELGVGLQLPPPWYERWWVWAGAGTLVAGTVAAVLLATRPESSEVEGRYTVGP